MPDPTVPSPALTLDELLFRYNEHAHHLAQEEIGGEAEGLASRRLLAAACDPLRDEPEADDLRSDYNSLVGQNLFLQGMLVGARLQAGENINYEDLVLEASNVLTPVARAILNGFEGKEPTPCPGCAEEMAARQRLPLAERLALVVGSALSPEEAAEIVSAVEELDPETDHAELLAITEYFRRHESAAREFKARREAQRLNRLLEKLNPEDFDFGSDSQAS